MQITKNFNLKEFRSNLHNKAGFEVFQVPEYLLGNVKTLANQLQVIRDYIDLPIKINSAYRTPLFNKSVGGAKNSQHLYAKAADLKTELEPKKLYDIIEYLINDGQILEGGLGLYPTFVHYDIRGTKARW